VINASVRATRVQKDAVKLLDIFKKRSTLLLSIEAIESRLIASTFARLFLVFGKEGWQFELFEVMLQKDLRFLGRVRHAATPSRSAE
jgi:hypothetical protein